MGRKSLFNDREKWCPGCVGWLPLTSFGVCRSHPSGRTSRCNTCSNKLRDRGKDAAYHRKHRYNLTEEQYQEFLRTQHGRCALCKLKKKLVVDHDHNSDMVRGLLCISCNALLGKLDFDPSMMLRVVIYLGLHRNKVWVDNIRRIGD